MDNEIDAAYVFGVLLTLAIVATVMWGFAR